MQREDAWIVFAVMEVGMVLLMSGLFLYERYWMPFVLPGFNESQLDLTIDIFNVYLFSSIFLLGGTIASAVLYARRRFIYVESSAIASVLASIILVIIFVPEHGIIGAAWAVMFGSAVQLLLTGYSLGIPYIRSCSIRRVQKIPGKMRSQIIGGAYLKTDIVLDRYLMSLAPEGEMTIFVLARQILTAINTVVGKVWGNTSIPILADYFKRGNGAGFLAFYRRRSAWVFLVSLVVAFLLCAFLWSVDSLILRYTKFSAADTGRLFVYVLLLSGVVLFGGVGVVLSGGFYASGDVHSPMYIAVITYTVFTIGKVIAFNYLGIAGICVALSIYYLVNASLIFLTFERRVVKRSNKW